ncbi:MAG: hypothetical protein AB7D27_02905 [Desulfomicrobium sp.]
MLYWVDVKISFPQIDEIFFTYPEHAAFLCAPDLISKMLAPGKSKDSAEFTKRLNLLFQTVNTEKLLSYWWWNDFTNSCSKRTREALSAGAILYLQSHSVMCNIDDSLVNSVRFMERAYNLNVLDNLEQVRGIAPISKGRKNYNKYRDVLHLWAAFMRICNSEAPYNFKDYLRWANFFGQISFKLGNNPWLPCPYDGFIWTNVEHPKKKDEFVKRIADVKEKYINEKLYAERACNFSTKKSR